MPKRENSFYDREELLQFGFKKLGEDVLLSRKASIYGAADISLGDHSRIDDFCILSGKVTIGKYVHISAFSALYGGDAGIVFDDFSGISAKGTVYAVSDDFSGEYMTNSMVPIELRNVTEKQVVIGKYCQIGAGCVIFPGVHMYEGAALGAMSLARNDLEAWQIYAGIPCICLKERKRRILELVSKIDNVCNG